MAEIRDAKSDDAENILKIYDYIKCVCSYWVSGKE